MTALFSQGQEVLVKAQRISCMYVYCPEVSLCKRSYSCQLKAVCSSSLRSHAVVA
jgi:hypothetical protein